MSKKDDVDENEPIEMDAVDITLSPSKDCEGLLI
jgi:hypothetical protein